MLYHIYILVEWLKNHTDEEILPLYGAYSPQQLFWLSSAQWKCSKLTDQKLRELVLSSVYAPFGARINGTAMSSPEFSKDFNCALGSPMNPNWSSITGCKDRGKTSVI